MLNQVQMKILLQKIILFIELNVMRFLIVVDG